MDDHYELISQGVSDTLSGNESYAQRYYQGQLFSHDVVGFRHIDGTEGLFQTVMEKIKAFCAWVSKKIKSLFTTKPFFFTVKSGSILKCFHRVDEHNDLDNYEFKAEAWRSYVAKTRTHWEAIKLRLNNTVEQNLIMVKMFQELSKEPNVIFSNVTNLSETVFRGTVGQYIKETETMLDALEKMDSAKKLSDACQGILYTNLKTCFKMTDSMLQFTEYRDFAYDRDRFELNKAMEKVLSGIEDQKLQTMVAGALTRMVNMNTSFRESSREVDYNVALSIHQPNFWTKKK